MYVCTYIHTPTKTATTTGSRIMARRDPRIRPCLIVPSRYKLTGVLAPPLFLSTVSLISFLDRKLRFDPSRSWEEGGGRKVKGRSTRVVSFPPRRCSVRTYSWLVRISTGTDHRSPRLLIHSTVCLSLVSSGTGRPRIYHHRVIFRLDPI